MSSTARKIIEVLAAGGPLPITELPDLCDMTPGHGYDDALASVTFAGLATSTDPQLNFVHDLVAKLHRTHLGAQPIGQRVFVGPGELAETECLPDLLAVIVRRPPLPRIAG